MVIDEAAAIPLPIVRELIGPYLVFMSSTINGYEGTGRSLSLKLLDQLRKSSVDKLTPRGLREVTLDESIRYRSGDAVEAWLNRLLCLDAGSMSNHLGSPVRSRVDPPRPRGDALDLRREARSPSRA